MANALAAREWIVAALGEGAVARHMIAGTANPKAAAEWGLPACNVFPFGEWIGGRYSLWSSVGLPIAIAIGMARFEQLLAGRARRGPALPLRSARAQRSRAVGPHLRLESQRAGHREPRDAALCLAHGKPARLRAAARDGIERQARLGRRMRCSTTRRVPSCGAASERRASTRSTSGCTRAATWRAATSSWLRTPWGRNVAHHEILLAHACAQSEALMNGVDSPDATPGLPGKSTEHDDRDAAPRCRINLGRAARDLRAQGLHRGHDLGRGPLRPVRRRARQIDRRSRAPGRARRGSIASSGHAAPARGDRSASGSS